MQTPPLRLGNVAMWPLEDVGCNIRKWNLNLVVNVWGKNVYCYGHVKHNKIDSRVGEGDQKVYRDSIQLANSLEWWSV